MAVGPLRVLKSSADTEGGEFRVTLLWVNCSGSASSPGFWTKTQTEPKQNVVMVQVFGRTRRKQRKLPGCHSDTDQMTLSSVSSELLSHVCPFTPSGADAHTPDYSYFC